MKHLPLARNQKVFFQNLITIGEDVVQQRIIYLSFLILIILSACSNYEEVSTNKVQEKPQLEERPKQIVKEVKIINSEEKEEETTKLCN
ncbi:hypothetical protein [Rossellomorea sp. GCM10028870]|uniref:hypothetical protein n=1 Tax=Rossellomorea sp. GCM10028870 TaxID=3273426 RepID=UPI00263597CA|nr:hypothetical protein [uncultured Rossellomorea sp.]